MLTRGWFGHSGINPRPGAGIRVQLRLYGWLGLTNTEQGWSLGWSIIRIERHDKWVTYKISMPALWIVVDVDRACCGFYILWIVHLVDSWCWGLCMLWVGYVLDCECCGLWILWSVHIVDCVCCGLCLLLVVDVLGWACPCCARSGFHIPWIL